MEDLVECPMCYGKGKYKPCTEEGCKLNRSRSCVGCNDYKPIYSAPIMRCTMCNNKKRIPWIDALFSH